jgi:hypothetical protein
VKKLPAQAAVSYARRKGWIDIRGGLALLRSRDVPVGLKASSLGLGLALTLLLEAIEFPVELLLDGMTLGLATPILALIDGLEIITLPILFGAAILARRFPTR